MYVLHDNQRQLRGQTMQKPKKHAVIYAFDPKTGFIGQVVSSSWELDHPVWKTPHIVISDGYIAVERTTVNSYGEKSVYSDNVSSGWSFTVDADGNPTLDEDGCLKVSPPPHGVGDPDIHIYNFLANIKAGHIDPLEVHQDVIRDVNHVLVKAGKRPIEGTTVWPHPIHTAKAKTKRA